MCRSAFVGLRANLPRTPALNTFILRAQFLRAHGRWPLRSTHPNATFNDFIFERIKNDNWTLLERFCIDKEYAKMFVSVHCPELKMAKTMDVIAIYHDTVLADISERVCKHLGQAAVAKPTHGSGCVLFLSLQKSKDAVERFCEDASRNYYEISRESQYQSLDRKIIIEEDLSDPRGAPLDYKFFCARGEFLFCQVDVDRFSGHRRLLVDENFAPIDVRYQFAPPDYAIHPPQTFRRMVQIAQRLSEKFDFVRVDLYEVNGMPHFGELTFAAAGAAGTLSRESFGISVMKAIREASTRADKQNGPAP